MMYRRSRYDHLITGILTGLLVPVAGYFIFYLLYELLDQMDILNPEGMAPNFRERTIKLLAIILNAVPMQLFDRRGWQDAMRGMIFPTLLFVGLWMYYFGFELLKF